MKTNKLMLCAAGLMLLLTVVAASAADAPKLTFKFSKADVPGALQTTPFSVNNAGIMVGWYEDTGGNYQGYILDGNHLTTVDHPNSTFTTCSGVSQNGKIGVVGVTGFYTNSSGNGVGFLYRKGKFTDIPGPAGAMDSYADAINDKGEIVGTYYGSNKVAHGFFLKGIKSTKYTTLDVPGATGSHAPGINDKGWIVLYWTDSEGAHESSITKNYGNTYTKINVPGASGGSQAVSIDSAGDVGYEWSKSGSTVTHGALCTNCGSHSRKYHKFDYPHSVFTSPNGINDKHVIVGPYETEPGGPDSGFKATYK
jgi:uncharacterized membrane protein